ncbi:restriction endonuclease subunit S [Priestia megaterium]|uniref:restriction endonuclease subunit S n=1 Tax=Priestia megaterium TaxID=1404 RepID=UPI00300B559C
MKEIVQNRFQNLKLKDIAKSIQYGYTTSASYEKDATYKFLRITDIQDQKVNWDDVPFAEGLNDEKIASKFLIESGDIVFARTGATTGKSFLISECKFPTVFASYLIRVRPDESIINPKYLYLFFQSPNYWMQVEKNKRGAAQAGINASVLGQLDIPVLPIEEQLKVIEVLDKAQKLLNKRKLQVKALSSLVQSIFLKMFGDPLVNNCGYKTHLLKDICDDIKGGGTPSKSKPEYYDGDIPWVTPKDMKTLLIKDSIDHINEEAINNSSTKLIPPNSLLMVIRSGILKKNLPVAINKREVTLNQDMKAFVLNKEIITPEYLLLFFRNYQRKLLSQVRSVTADNLDFNQIKNIQVPIPPIEKQNEFSNRFNQINNLIKGIQKQILIQEDFYNSLMQRVFKGELFND